MEDQLSTIMQMLGKLDERTELLLKEVSGNGQKGLKQRIEDLEASKNRLWGIGTAVTFITGIVEYFIHKKP